MSGLGIFILICIGSIWLVSMVIFLLGFIRSTKRIEIAVDRAIEKIDEWDINK